MRNETLFVVLWAAGSEPLTSTIVTSPSPRALPDALKAL